MTSPQRPRSVYAGLDESRRRVVPGPHLLVSGPTGVGKTRRVLAPSISMWGAAPVVAVSSKRDFYELTAGTRANYGPVYVMDLVADDLIVPEGYTKVRSEPALDLQTVDDALDMASLLLRTGSLGGGSGGGSDSSMDFWNTQAVSPLAALLWAARLKGDVMTWVVEAVGRPGADSEEDMLGPCWPGACAILVEHGDTEQASALMEIAAADDRLRDSVIATMRTAIAPWRRKSVANPALTPWRTDMLDAGGTLYVIAPAHGVAAGAAVSTVDAMISRWREWHDRLLPLHICIDELTNTCPLPELPTYVTEARGLGVSLTVAVQNTEQLRLRYGDAGCDVLRLTFPTTLCLYGADEWTMYESATRYLKPSEVGSRSYSEGDHGARSTRSLERRPSIEPHDLVPTNLDEARLLRGSAPGQRVYIPDISTIRTTPQGD